MLTFLKLIRHPIMAIFGAAACPFVATMVAALLVRGGSLSIGYQYDAFLRLVIILLSMGWLGGLALSWHLWARKAEKLERAIIAILAHLGGAFLAYGSINPYILIYKPRQDRKTQETMHQMQAISQAWATYCYEKGYCCPPGPGRDRFAWGNISSDMLNEMLGDRLKRNDIEITLQDGWGHPLQFGALCQCDIKFDPQHPSCPFAIRSSARDGLWDAERYGEKQFSRLDYDRDLVLGSRSWIVCSTGRPPSGDGGIPVLDRVRIYSVFPPKNN